MNSFGKSACLVLALASVIGAAPANDQVQAGRQVSEWRCRNCHGGTAPTDYPIGPSLARIVGSRAGSNPTGMPSRPMMDSGVVWDRESLRRFGALSNTRTSRYQFQR
jgi:cytochrome c2